jgi:pilus assembly protein CpaB
MSVEERETMRISSGTLVLGVFAALFGLVGAYVAKQYLAEPPLVEVEPPKVELVAVPTAAVDLPVGRTISIGDIIVRRLTWQQIRDLELPDEFMDQLSQLTGRTLRGPIAKGMSFRPEDLYPEGTGPSVAERLRPGYRAVSLSLEDSYAELSLLSPGAIVDVLFRTFPNGSVPETTVTLLEHVEILAIGEQAYPGGRVNGSNGSNGSRRTAAITLACTPGQAAALKVVEGQGALSLALRGAEEDEEDLLAQAAPGPQTLQSLLDLPAPKPPVTTQIYRRGRLTTVVFEDGQQVGGTEGFSGLPVPAEKPQTDLASVVYRRTVSSHNGSQPASGATTDSSCSGCGKQ